MVDLPRSPDGKRRQRWRTVHGTRADADRALRTLLRELDQGTWRDDRVTVAEFTADWLAARRVAVEATTWRTQEGIMRLHVLPVIGDTPLTKITGTTLSKLYANLDLAPSTVGRVHATVRKMLSDAVKDDVLAVNPAPRANRPKEGGERDAIRVWTPDQLATFLEGTIDERWWPMWVTVAVTGMRRGETLGLQWRDLDLVEGYVRVERQRRHDGIHALKSPSSRRIIASGDGATGALKGWRQTVLEDRFRLGLGAPPDDGLVFCWPDGTAPVPTTVSKWFRKASARLELPRIRLHDLRHTAATDALRRGHDVKVVSLRLGHASTTITRDIYQHSVPELDAGLAQDANRVVPARPPFANPGDAAGGDVT